MLVVCERWVGDGDRQLHTDPSSSDHSILTGVAQPWVTEGPKPSVCRWLSHRHLVSNWLQLQLTQAVCVLVIFLFNVHLLPLFFRLFRLVHLLIDGSVEGQTLGLEPQYQKQFSVISRTLNGFKYSYLSLIILFNIIHSFAHSWMMPSIAI